MGRAAVHSPRTILTLFGWDGVYLQLVYDSEAIAVDANESPFQSFEAILRFATPSPFNLSRRVFQGPRNRKGAVFVCVLCDSRSVLSNDSEGSAQGNAHLVCWGGYSRIQ